MCSGPLFSDAIESMQILEGPYHQFEGVAGYIETVVSFKIKDLSTFARLWESWYTLKDTQRTNLYGLAKGLGDCK